MKKTITVTDTVTFVRPVRSAKHLLSGNIFLLLLLALGLWIANPCVATPGQWDFTNSLTSPRELHTATLLPNGQVLVAAGGIE